MGILITDAILELFQNNLGITEINAGITESSTYLSIKHYGYQVNKQQHTVATYNANSVFPAKSWHWQVIDTYI